MSSTNSTNRKQSHEKHSSRITPKIREYLAEMAHDREVELERFMALSSSSPASSPQAEQVPPPAAIFGSLSVEDLRTPTKSTQTQAPQLQTRKTQTPESALKSHKRLEWDPAADVGYRCERAVSTSNISTLERSVLEAAMQPTQRSNQSDTELNRLQAQSQPQPQPLMPAATPAPAPAATPALAPLASSTFHSLSRNSSRAQATPVTASSSRRESCVTSSAASSFDYQAQHSRSASSVGGTATSNSSSRRHTLSAEQLLRHVEQQRQEREYAARLQQVLCSRQNKENQLPSTAQHATPSSSAGSINSLASAAPAKCDLDLGVDLLCSLVNKRSLSHGQKKQLVRDIARRLACLELSAGTATATNTTNSSEVTVLIKRMLMPFVFAVHAALLKDAATNTTHRSSGGSSRSVSEKRSSVEHQLPVTVTAPVPVPAPVPAPRRHLGTPSPLPACSYASTSSGASNELITQKTNPPRAKSTEPEQVLQEWLNPMTQSELDYEQKRREQQQQELEKQQQQLQQQEQHEQQLDRHSSLDTERRTQLHWIETEIQRLRTLQQLLHNAHRSFLEPKQREKSSQDQAPHGEHTEVHVDIRVEKPAVAVRSRSRATPPSPVLLAAVAADAAPAAAAPAPAAPVERPLQRSKMATPTLSHSGSSESVCSFVQQRQRQFMAHYQNQQQQRLEQQQQQLQLLQAKKKQQQPQQQQEQVIPIQQTQRMLQDRQHQPRSCPPEHCHQHRHQHCQQPHLYMPMQYAPGYSCLDEGAVYYQVLDSQGVPCYVQATEATAAAAGAVATVAEQATATAATGVVATAAAPVAASGSSNRSTTRTSTSSMLCISSEMSIPMGTVSACEATTTTTTTTTHQYDDVACRLQHAEATSTADQEHQQQQQQQQQRHYERMLQVRPCGIAYLIQFSVADGSSELLPELMSLQDQLQRARPQFCAKSKERKAILNQMQLLRNDRRRELEELVEGASLEMLDKRLDELPPPATSRVRVFTTKEMKALTNKRCEKLPEVLAAQNREREERRRRSNRLLRDVFNKRLQRRVRCGKLSLNHSRTVI
ncbi:hypothetical protein KR222_001883 [Zaprionus bogoriensis]|nr:hypothetical protein KR222_001883 [Zaprionus bogoriensis]